MDHLDKEVIESLSEPAKRVFESLDYRSKQRMLKKAREMAKTEKMKRRKKSRFKKKGIEKLNKGTHTAVGGMKTLVHKNLQSREKRKAARKSTEKSAQAV